MAKCKDPLSKQKRNLPVEKNGKWQALKVKHLVQTSLETTAIALVMGGVFFSDYKGLLICFPVSLLYAFGRIKELKSKEMYTLREQVRDALNACAAAMETGYAANNAIYEAYKEMKMIWGEDSQVVKSLLNMREKIKLHMPIEQLMVDWAKETQLKELKQLASLFGIAKNGSGKLGELLKTTSKQMSERLEVEKEIQVQITEKKTEFYMMMAMPVAMIIFLRMGYPDMIQPLYQIMAGKICMTICLVIYATAWCMGRKIVAIEMKG